MAWSPHDAEKFVMVTEDGVAEVLDINTQTVLATYLYPHFESLTAVIWSPLEADLIITGTKDYVISIWSISENPAKTEEEISTRRKATLKEITKETADLVPKFDEHATMTSPKKDKKAKPTLLPKIYTNKDGSFVGDLKKLIQWKSGDRNVESKIGDTNEIDILDLFGTKKNMTKLIELNQISLLERGKYQFRDMLQFFRGDILTVIQDAIEAKRVTPWIISIAPMVAPRLWTKACDVYIEQLSQAADADPFELVTYLLVRHRVRDAVRALCDADCFAEAFALARMRFPEDDETVDGVTLEWAERASTWGNFELAAQCYTFLGKYQDAATVLFRRESLEPLEAALVLAEKSGNEDLRKAVEFRYNEFKNYVDKSDTDKGVPSTSKVEIENGDKLKCSEKVKQNSKEEAKDDTKLDEVKKEENGEGGSQNGCEEKKDAEVDDKNGPESSEEMKVERSLKDVTKKEPLVQSEACKEKNETD